MPSGVERRQVLRGAVWAAPAIAVCASAAAVNTSQLNPVYSGYSWNQGAPANIPNGYDPRRERDARINADQTYYFGFYTMAPMVMKNSLRLVGLTLTAPLTPLRTLVWLAPMLVRRPT